MEDQSSSSPDREPTSPAPSRRNLTDEQEILLTAARLTRQLSSILNDREPILDTVQMIRGELAVVECFQNLQNRCKRDFRLSVKITLGREDEGVRIPFGCGMLLGKNVRDKRLYDFSGLSKESEILKLEDVRPSGTEVRTFHEVPFNMALFDYSAALIGIKDEADSVHAAILVRPSPALNIIDSVYNSLWKLGSPLQTSGGWSHGFTAEDRQVLELLADGATDHQVAKQLGVSVRTVQRKINDLMSRLGAETRFQAGINASNRGWV